MFTFFGSIKGSHGEATRGSNKADGIKVSSRCKNGSLITKMYYDKNNELMIDVSCSLTNSETGKKVFSGTFADFTLKIIG